jgi:nicotinate-nucleotide pyrophosphorylase (carboxylating)
MTAKIYMKKPGILSGVPVAKMTFEILAPECLIETFKEDGARCEPGDVVMAITGPAWIFASGERLALDYLQHLSGIATEARKYVDLVAPYGTRISDARKGIPPIRVLQKYAVRKGGAIPHMYSLHNAILLKDNHIKMAGGITSAVKQLRERGQHTLKIECECETLEQTREALACGVECIMFDNMDLDVLQEAVQIVGDKAWTVGTGGVNEQTVVPIARTGVKQIAIGGIVHSAKVVDISIDIGDLKASAIRDIARARAA